MATAQVLKVTHTVDDRLRVVENRVIDVDNKVAGVDDRVAGVDERVAGVDDRVACVGERVAGVDDNIKDIDDKVAVIIDGAQPFLFGQQENKLNSDVPRRKTDEGCHTTSRRRHGSSKTLVIFFFLHSHGMQAKAFLQGIKYDRTFGDGSLPRIHLLTTTLLVVLIASKQRTGSSKEVSSPNGNPMGHFCGSTESVRSPDLFRACGS